MKKFLIFLVALLSLVFIKPSFSCEIHNFNFNKNGIIFYDENMKKMMNGVFIFIKKKYEYKDVKVSFVIKAQVIVSKDEKKVSFVQSMTAFIYEDENVKIFVLDNNLDGKYDKGYRQDKKTVPPTRKELTEEELIEMVPKINELHGYIKKAGYVELAQKV